MEQRGRRGRLTAVVLAVLLLPAGALLLVIGLRAQQHPPQPPPSAAAVVSTTPASPAPSASGAPRISPSQSSSRPSAASSRGPLLPPSVPARLEIPSIGISSNLLQLGIGADHSVEVPPLGRDSRAGWFRYSPTPGQLGPSLILGHVDSVKYGPGVFFRLGALRLGSSVTVVRSDHTVAVFRVDRVVSYPKDHFPVLEVYGNTDHAGLRLITCGGRFDFGTHSYVDNIVAFASLVSSHPA